MLYVYGINLNLMDWQMLKNRKIKVLLFLLVMVFSVAIVTFNAGLNTSKIANVILSNEKKEAIKKYIFPYRLISQQETIIAMQKEFLKDVNFSEVELRFKNSNKDIEIQESIVDLSNSMTLKKYKLNSGFYAAIHAYRHTGEMFYSPGTGYIDFFENTIFVLSSRGVLAYRNDLVDDRENFQQISNNINDFIGIDQFYKSHKFSIKDLLIFDKKIFVSFTEEIEEDCWNTSIIYGNINYKNIVFKKLFSPRECIHSINNADNEFTANQSGGRIVPFDNDHILLSIGDYRSRHLAQNQKSVNGKVIKVKIDGGEHKIISMGHRNPQGLYFDKENNFVLETEHGPKGGDEINLIEIKKLGGDNIQNYGWPQVSAGEHYGGRSEKNKAKYKKYPLLKSHSENGFLEPLKIFVPSIAISEIVKIGENKYVVSSMKKAIYFFQLSEKRQLINLEKVEVFERVRDLKFQNNKLYLFLETSASIGVINLN